jgi:NAD(P)-dependent dehydrogenase (short-subunit alcohol dehydrogenase family)
VQIRDHVFIVTGAASGLGAATVRRLAADGAKVVAADINGDAVESLAEVVGEGVRPLTVDVTSEADGQAAIELAREAFGAVHGLVCCAGIVIGEKIVGRDKPHALDRFARVVGVNLLGVFNMMRLAAFAMSANPPNEKGERGVVVNTSSIAAFDGQIGQAAYAASKAGVAGLTLPAARELARVGIRVVSIAPGLFETPMMAGLPAEMKAELGRAVPFPPRLGDPAEFADLVCAIVANSMLNGEVIRLDGALRMAPK